MVGNAKTSIHMIHFYTSGDLYKFYNKFGINKVNYEYIMSKVINL